MLIKPEKLRVDSASRVETLGYIEWYYELNEYIFYPEKEFECITAEELEELSKRMKNLNKEYTS